MAIQDPSPRAGLPTAAGVARDTASAGAAEEGNDRPDYSREATYRLTRTPVERAMTLLPDAYRSRDFFELERQRVFASGWVCVGYASQAAKPGDCFLADVAGQPLFVTRDEQGSLRAFYNVCRHRGSQLLAADGHHDVIRCPYHSWGYALDGRLLGCPYFKGLDVPPEEQALYDMSETKEFNKDDYPLLRVAVDSWGSFIFVHLAAEPSPLASWLGDLAERFRRHPLAELKLVRRRQIPVRANWKLIAENFMEYYHLPWVHPELCRVSGFGEHARCQGPGMYTGMCTSPLTYDAANPVGFMLPAMPGLNESESQSAYWILLFPNLALFLLPDHLFTLLLRPDGPDGTVEYADLLVHPSALGQAGAEQAIDRIFAFWDMVNAQDIAAVERVQQGLRAQAYTGGRMCYRFEEPIHRFQNIVIDRMTGAQRVPAGDG